MEDQHWHWSLILEYCNLSSDSNVDILLQDGIDSLPVLVLASLSPMIKDYLLDVDTLEPLVTIPDLPSYCFRVFKRYLFASDLSEIVNTQEIKTIVGMVVVKENPPFIPKNLLNTTLVLTVMNLNRILRTRLSGFYEELQKELSKELNDQNCQKN